MVAGLKAAYKENVLHRDIKPENIFLDEGKGVLGDFGLCRILERKDQLIEGAYGSPMYMSPESLQNMQYGLKSDLYSLGIILFEMIYGNVPYHCNTIEELLVLIHEEGPKFDEEVVRIPKSVRNLILVLVEPNPEQRITHEELFSIVLDDKSFILKHSFGDKEDEGASNELVSKDIKSAKNAEKETPSYWVEEESISCTKMEVKVERNSIGINKENRKMSIYKKEFEQNFTVECKNEYSEIVSESRRRRSTSRKKTMKRYCSRGSRSGSNKRRESNLTQSPEGPGKLDAHHNPYVKMRNPEKVNTDAASRPSIDNVTYNFIKPDEDETASNLTSGGRRVSYAKGRDDRSKKLSIGTGKTAPTAANDYSSFSNYTLDNRNSISRVRVHPSQRQEPTQNNPKNPTIAATRGVITPEHPKKKAGYNSIDNNHANDHNNDDPRQRNDDKMSPEFLQRTLEKKTLTQSPSRRGYSPLKKDSIEVQNPRRESDLSGYTPSEIHIMNYQIRHTQQQNMTFDKERIPRVQSMKQNCQKDTISDVYSKQDMDKRTVLSNRVLPLSPNGHQYSAVDLTERRVTLDTMQESNQGVNDRGFYEGSPQFEYSKVKTGCCGDSVTNGSSNFVNHSFGEVTHYVRFFVIFLILLDWR